MNCVDYLDLKEDEIVLKAVNDLEFMEQFNILHLPLTALPLVYKGYLIRGFLDQRVDHRADVCYDGLIKTSEEL